MKCSVCGTPEDEKNKFFIAGVCQKCYRDVQMGKINSRNMKLYIKLKSRGKIR